MLHTHSSKRLSRRSASAFSLVEMIGVLAIIAILAVVIVPKVFSTIASSRVTSTAASIGAIKSAVTEFSGKYGTLPTTNGNQRVDDLLLTANLLESRFSAKIGTQPGTTPPASATWARSATGTWTPTGGTSQAGQSRIISLTSNTTAPATANGANYQLNGTTNLPAGSRVVSAVLVNITGTEARELSMTLDGETLSAATATVADAAGKVVYNTPNATTGLTTAYIYVAHQ